MTVKQLRATLAPYNDLIIDNGHNKITLTAEDPATLESLANYVIESICIEDEETITARLKLRPVIEE